MSHFILNKNYTFKNFDEYLLAYQKNITHSKKYITSPIFYANSKPHIGHIYTGLVCDTWVKCNGIFNNEVEFVSGMDEHGQKVHQTAEKMKVSTKEYVDQMNANFIECFKNYDINYTKWIRTTSYEHKVALERVWRILEKNGYIYKSKYSGWYSISDENYLDFDKDYINTNPNIVWREEECYYFKLSAFEDKLREFYQNNKSIIYPNSRYNETIGLLDQGLKDFAISRPKERLSWGIEVDNDPSQVIYVWIDALSAYLSAIGYPDDKYKKLWPAIHVIGKDILKFHTIYWPALLMAIGLELPKQIIIHGWWLNGDQKISKSLNNAIDIGNLVESYGYDSFRYYLLSNMTLGEDGSFKETLFEQNIETVLSNKFGNLFSRLIGIAKRHSLELLKFNKALLNSKFIEELSRLRENILIYSENLSKLNLYIQSFNDGLEFLNVYVNDNKIWELTGEQLNNELYSLFYVFKHLALFYYPLLPNACSKILDYFDTKSKYEDALKFKNIIIKENVLLFPRLSISKNEKI